jgi:hypothetical protein
MRKEEKSGKPHYKYWGKARKRGDGAGVDENVSC